MKETEREINVRHNLSDCRNRVHDFCNHIAPELLNILAEGFKLTKSYQLYEKDKVRLQSVLDNHKELRSLGIPGSRSSACVRSNEFDIVLEVTDNYPVKYHNGGGGSYICEYYKKTVYLWNNRKGKAVDFNTLALSTHHEIDSACVEVEEIKAKIAELQNKLYPLKRLIGE